MNKSAIALLLAASAGPVWAAAPAAPSADRLAACSAIQDAAARLACFDRATAPPPPLQTSTAPPATVVAAPSPAATKPEATARTSSPSFGEEQLAANQRAPANEDTQVMHAHITALKPAASGRFLVTLDNGQVWRHEDAYLGAYLKEGEAVTITKATLGTYRLVRDAGQAKNWIRVTRYR